MPQIRISLHPDTIKRLKAEGRGNVALGVETILVKLDTIIEERKPPPQVAPSPTAPQREQPPVTATASWNEACLLIQEHEIREHGHVLTSYAPNSKGVVLCPALDADPARLARALDTYERAYASEAARLAALTQAAREQKAAATPVGQIVQLQTLTPERLTMFGIKRTPIDWTDAQIEYWNEHITATAVSPEAQEMVRQTALEPWTREEACATSDLAQDEGVWMTGTLVSAPLDLNPKPQPTGEPVMLSTAALIGLGLFGTPADMSQDDILAANAQYTTSADES